MSSTWLLRHDTHELYGERLLHALAFAADALKGHDTSPLTVALQQWSAAWVAAERLEQDCLDAHADQTFNVDRFLQRTAACAEAVGPWSERLHTALRGLHEATLQFLADKGAPGSAQLEALLGACARCMGLGSVLRNVSLRFGVEAELDVVQAMEAVESDAKRAWEALELDLWHVQGALSSPGPAQTPPELAHVRTFVALTALQLTVRCALASVQQVVSLFVTDTPAQRLLEETDRFFQGLLACTTAFGQQVSPLESALSGAKPINYEVLPQYLGAVEHERFMGPNYEKVTGMPNTIKAAYQTMGMLGEDAARAAQASQTSVPIGKPAKPQALPVLPSRGKQYWEELGNLTGLQQAYEAVQRRARSRLGVGLSPEAMMGVFLTHQASLAAAKQSREYEANMHALLEENEGLSAPPERKAANRKAILDLFNSAVGRMDGTHAKAVAEHARWITQKAMRKAGDVPNRLGNWLREQGLQSRQDKQAQPQEPAPSMAGMHPVSAERLASAFGQEVMADVLNEVPPHAALLSEEHVSPADLTARIRATLFGERLPKAADPPAPRPVHEEPEASAVPAKNPMLAALNALLGTDGDVVAPSHVQITPAGPSPIAVPAQPLACLLGVALLTYPPAALVALFELPGLVSEAQAKARSAINLRAQ